MRIQSASKPRKDERFTYTEGIHVAKPTYDAISALERRYQCVKGIVVRRIAHVAKAAHEA